MDRLNRKRDGVYLNRREICQHVVVATAAMVTNSLADVTGSKTVIVGSGEFARATTRTYSIRQASPSPGTPIGSGIVTHELKSNCNELKSYASHLRSLNLDAEAGQMIVRYTKYKHYLEEALKQDSIIRDKSALKIRLDAYTLAIGAIFLIIGFTVSAEITAYVGASIFLQLIVESFVMSTSLMEISQKDDASSVVGKMIAICTVNRGLSLFGVMYDELGFSWKNKMISVFQLLNGMRELGNDVTEFSGANERMSSIKALILEVQEEIASSIKKNQVPKLLNSCRIDELEFLELFTDEKMLPQLCTLGPQISSASVAPPSAPVGFSVSNYLNASSPWINFLKQ